jgi:hypothetical protein
MAPRVSAIDFLVYEPVFLKNLDPNIVYHLPCILLTSKIKNKKIVGWHQLLPFMIL